MTAIDFLNSLFSTNYLPSVFVRSVGVNLLDRLWPAKVFLNKNLINLNFFRI